MKEKRSLASRLKDRIRIEQPAPDESPDGAGSGTWQLVAEVAAEVQDVLPSRGERLVGGFNVTTRPARVRIRHRADVAAQMRVLIGHYEKDGDGDPAWQTDREAQIVTAPAKLGRDGTEFMIEDYSTAGNPA